MKRLVLTAVGCLLLSVPALASADSDCATMWKEADVNNDGVLSGVEADRYTAWMRIANKKMSADGTIDEAYFIENCNTGAFTTAAVEDGAPLKGANSFTEGQAKDRIVAAGFSGVSDLRMDSDGIWRGNATKDNKNVNVAVDYKGNVVAG